MTAGLVWRVAVSTWLCRGDPAPRARYSPGPSPSAWRCPGYPGGGLSPRGRRVAWRWERPSC